MLGKYLIAVATILVSSQADPLEVWSVPMWARGIGSEGPLLLTHAYGALHTLSIFTACLKKERELETIIFVF